MASSPPPPPQTHPPQILLSPKPDPDAPNPPNLAASPALNPKPEPIALAPELSNLRRRELEPSPDDHPGFADHLRAIIQHQLESIPANLRLVESNPQPEPNPQGSIPPHSDASVSASSSAAKKRCRGSARAGEMVRVNAVTPQDHAHFRALVRRARLTFHALRGIYQREGSPDGGARNRFDLRASSRMLSKGLWLYRDVRIVGPIPGVLVGDAFHYRAELCVVGLHCTPQAGIGYIPASLVSEGHPVATSIVSSGGYLDDKDSGEVLEYTGSGGRQRNRVEHHADQTLERGNLALHYSCHYGVEVRVIRRHDCESSPNGKVYVYDGLYKVVSSNYGPGKSGRDVCKYTLVRLPCQEELGSRNWCLAKDIKDKLATQQVLPDGYISLDMSNGKEAFCIPVFNDVDHERSLLDFDYIAHPEFPLPMVTVPVEQHQGCHCETSCSSECVCVRKNGGGPVYNEDGTLIRGRPVVYECGALCGCTMNCLNRSTQRGMKHRLEVFRSIETEWGVRTLELIQPGAFVCEYSGDVVTGEFTMAMVDECAIIDPKRFPKRWIEWGDASQALGDDDKAPPQPQFLQFQEPGYVLDVSRRRNLASYISHSCTPNVFVQFVVRGDEDESCPHPMVFAMDAIPPMRELSIDYGID